MKKSEILREARKILEIKETRYVCLAIRTVVSMHILDKETLEGGHGLVWWIENSISPSTTVRDWLITKAGIDHIDATDEAMLDYRLRWIDSMIADYEAIGE